MYILIVLNVDTSTVEVIDAFNDELVAQNNFLEKIAALSVPKDGVDYDSIMISKTKCNIVKKISGWTSTYKSIEKVVTLHHNDNYDITDQ